MTQHEFQNHVETEVHDQPMPGTRPSPDYLEPDLIQSRVLNPQTPVTIIRPTLGNLPTPWLRVVDINMF